MSESTVRATRIKREQDASDRHSAKRFPYFASIDTSVVDRVVPDSAGTATTLTSGERANFAVIGCNATISSRETDCDKIKANAVPSILQWAVDTGKVVGLVTNTRITHATPAATYAHVANRDWEDDSALPANTTGQCKDIARQLIENKPGANLTVILGGGWRSFYPRDSLTQEKGRRLDGRNLVKEWLTNQKASRGGGYRFVNNSSSLKEAVADKSITSLLGLFSASHLAYEEERNKRPDGEPSLTEMVEAALSILKRADKKDNGFVLFVEGGRIDHAHHENKANMAILETLQFDNAIKAATKTVKTEETLVIVTADHGHTLTISGYAERGTRIDGGKITYEGAGVNGSDVTYGALMYATGPGHQTGGTLNLSHASDANARAHSAVYLAHSAHGGGYVGIRAVGPWAHLFKGEEHQSFIARVASHALCIGPFSARDSHHCKSEADKSTGHSRLPSHPYSLI